MLHIGHAVQEMSDIVVSVDALRPDGQAVRLAAPDLQVGANVCTAPAGPSSWMVCCAVTACAVLCSNGLAG